MTDHAAPAEHRRYQRRLAASGIIPPRAATRPRDCDACGERFDPGTEGVTRWGDEWATIYTATCPQPDCGSTVTTHERRHDDG